MTTDKNSMVQEVKDPNFTGDLPKEPTTKENTIQNAPAAMSGDMLSAFAALKKIVSDLRSLEEPNEDILAEAEGLVEHFGKTKMFTAEQYEWIENFVKAETDPPPVVKVNDLPPPLTPEEEAKIIADLEAKRKEEQLEKDKLAPVPPISSESVVGPLSPEKLAERVTPDMSPTGEETKDEVTPAPVEEEQPTE